MKNDEIRKERLVPLSAMKDYKVTKDNPDVTGWRVLGADGESLGIVKDLIVDPQALKARYLSVVADRRFFNTDKDQYMLIPIGVAALDKKARRVFVASIDAKSIAKYPVYPGGPIPANYELAVRDTFQQMQRDAIPDTTDNPRTDTPHIPDDFYNTNTYNEDQFYASNPQVTYPTHHYAQSDAAADLPAEDQSPKSVEDAIATIERLENLRERGSITAEEFTILKKKALNL